MQAIPTVDRRLRAGDSRHVVVIGGEYWVDVDANVNVAHLP